MEVFYVPLFFLLVVFLHSIVPFFLRKFQNLPPSPSISLPVIGHLYLLKKPLHRTLAEVGRKYGPVLSLQFGSRPVLLVSSPSAAEECFTKNDVVFANRPKLLAGRHLGYDYTTVVWAPYGDHWRNLRRVASTEILSANRIQMFAEIRRSEVRSMLRRLIGAGGEGYSGVVDMRTIFTDMVVNILMQMIAGKRYYDDGDESAGNSASSEEKRRFKEIVTETFEVSGASNVVDFLPFLRWIGMNRMEDKIKALQSRRDNLMRDLIEERKKSKSQDNRTLIDVLLSLQEADPEFYTGEIIRGMMQVMLSAGTDTSAATLEWAMSLLLNNPAALSKAHAEIAAQIGESRLVDDGDLAQLLYIRGIILETLRMHPVGPLLVPHESSAECSVGGYRVRRGTMLLVNAWAIQNDPSVWEEPTEFRPERFMNSGEGGGLMTWMAFGQGRRRCPGENLAMRVVGVALAALLQCFEWGRVGRELVDMGEASGLTMPKAVPLMAKCRLRGRHWEDKLVQ